MKKNKTMRAASALLVAVLLTTSVVSGTFAKYTTSDDASDSARVAKWGVTVVATGDTAFAEKYDDVASDEGIKVVSNKVTTVSNGQSIEGESVIAPGTKGTLGGIDINGTPEVMVNIAITADLELTGWTINNEEYCPIVFTIDGETYGLANATNIELKNSYNSIEALELAIEETIVELSATGIEANKELDAAYDFIVEWEWDFDADGAGTYDENDTALGNLTGDDVPEISFSCGATVTQVN